MKTKKILQQLDHEFNEAVRCQQKHKKGLNRFLTDIQALEKDLRNKLQQEGKKRKRKRLKQKLNILAQANMMFR